MSVSTEEAWVVEPELRDRPPRRIAAADRVDYNKPSTQILTISSGAVIITGLAVFAAGLVMKQFAFVIAGVVVALGGMAGIVVFPGKGKAYETKVNRLVEVGIPVPARLLAAENRGTEGGNQRFVKFQYQVPGQDEPRHGDTLVDYRALPKTIPSLVTALVDPETYECELYIALPVKAIAKPLDRSAQATVDTAEAKPTSTEMGSMSTDPAIVVKRKVETAPEQNGEKRESYE
ncbi:MAG: hypothetical protein ACKO14_07275 [Armatimonadota bacterium]